MLSHLIFRTRDGTRYEIEGAGMTYFISDWPGRVNVSQPRGKLLVFPEIKNGFRATLFARPQPPLGPHLPLIIWTDFVCAVEYVQ